MPRPVKKIEKSKDFSCSMKQIYSRLSNWRIILIISNILAFTSSIISLIAPNKLSDLTDYITEDITPRFNKNPINEIMTDKNISQIDKKKMMDIMGSIDKDKLPKSIYNKVKPKMNMKEIFVIICLMEKENILGVIKENI